MLEGAHFRRKRLAFGKTMLPIIRLPFPCLVGCWLLLSIGDKLAVVVEPVYRVGG